MAARRAVRRLRARVRDERGYSLLEATITIPALVLMVMLVVQYALIWHGRHVAEAAAQTGLRSARAYQSTPADGQAAAQSYLKQVAPTLLTGRTVTASATATAVTVTVRAHVLSVVPFGTFDVDERATGPVERFVTPAGN